MMGPWFPMGPPFMGPGFMGPGFVGPPFMGPPFMGSSGLDPDQYEVMYTLRSEFAKKGESPRKWMMRATPAERAVLMKYRYLGQRRAALGGLVGASVMAGVWNAAALGTGLGIAGVVVGGMIGARVSVRTSGIPKKMVTEMLTLPKDTSPRAAEARQILQAKIPDNSFVQEVLNKSTFTTKN